MFYKKKGFPEESELVICTVTSVQHNSVFARLDEYGSSGMIHISEISPGRIRNIRDFVKEGKVIVCKILSVNRERGHIDLSLRRVSEMSRVAKLNDIKLEERAEKIVELAAEQMKKNAKEVYDSIAPIILKDHPSLYSFFEDIVAGTASLEKIGIKGELAGILTEIIKQKIKPPEVVIKGKISIESYEPEGIEIIKAALANALKLNSKADIKYTGAGTYSIVVTEQDYKAAEKDLDKLVASIRGDMNDKGSVNFERLEE